jgi:hypothetical protein
VLPEDHVADETRFASQVDLVRISRHRGSVVTGVDVRDCGTSATREGRVLDASSMRFTAICSPPVNERALDSEM